MPAPSLQLAIDGHIAEIRFGDAEKRNALTAEFWNGIAPLFDQINASGSVRAVILRSEGPHFSSGIDLQFLAGLMPQGDGDPARLREQLRRRILTLQHAFNAIDACRVPVIAAVQGGCIGAGVDLVAACDIIYASADAYFSIQETNIGLAADLGSLQRLPRRMPFGLLRELAFTGRPLHAGEAHGCGFVTSVHTGHDATLAHARAIAATIATKSPLAILGTKQALQFGNHATIEQGLDYIATWNAGLMSNLDIQSGVAAAMKKTQPSYPDLAE